MIAEYRVEAALALLARLVEHRECLQVSAPLVALRALRGPERLAGLSPTPAGIARLRRSAALLVASSFMIRASIEGSPIDGVGECLRVCETSQQSAVSSMLDTPG